MNYTAYASAAHITHDQWLAYRRTGLGGSDAGAIMGVSPYKSAYAVWADKLGALPPAEDTEPMRQGRDLEDYVARRFMEETGLRVRRSRQMLRSIAHPVMLANIDRQVIGQRAGLECKTSRDIRMSRYKNGEYPLEYYAQCLHYLAVTGWDRWYLAVLVYGTGLLVYTIDRRGVEDDISALIAAEEAFWRDYVETRSQPAPDALESTTMALGAVWAAPDAGTAIDADAETDALLTDLAALRRQRRALDNRIAEAENRVKAAMGAAEEIRGTSARCLWKSVTSRRLDKKRLIAAGLEPRDFETTSTTRRFELKEENE